MLLLALSAWCVATAAPCATMSSTPATTAVAMEDTRAPSYARDVDPILQRHCVSCHGDTDPSGGLRLDSFAAVMRGGERGPVIVPRDPAASLLFMKVTRQDRPFMPPKKILSPSDIQILRGWIQAGAIR